MVGLRVSLSSGFLLLQQLWLPGPPEELPRKDGGTVSILIQETGTPQGVTGRRKWLPMCIFTRPSFLTRSEA